MKINELNSQSLLDGYKPLEVVNIKLLKEMPKTSYKTNINSWVIGDKKLNINLRKNVYRAESNSNNINKEHTQFKAFQKAMKILLIFGQCLGLNPVTAILDHDISKIRFKLYSWKFLYTIIVTSMQTVVACCCFNKLFNSNISLRSLAFTSVSFTTLSTTIISIQIATKWTTLVKELSNCKLDKYVDVGIITRCRVFCSVFILFGVVEYVLFFISRVSQVFDCTRNQYSIDEEIVRKSFPWYFETGLPYNMPIAVILQLSSIITAFNWTFPNMCIICISLYLASILNEINKNIIWASDKEYLHPSIWGTLREDYSRATRLVRVFDDVFSGLILTTFANNLFYICLQLFNLLENGMRVSSKFIKFCIHYPSGPFNGYEHPIYALFSMTYLIGRFLAVCIIAAKVNVASLVPASALNRVPSCAYSLEVQRFQDQVNDDIVALSGLEHFYVTNQLVLSVAGTILTYELVLLQFNSEELNNF